MLSINNLSFYFGGRALYQEANLHIKPKDRIGLIGLNGTGKSTLLRLIDGEYQPDEGSISKAGGCTIGFLNQDLLSYQTEDSILSVAMQAFEQENKLQQQINELLHQLEVSYTDSLIDKLTRLQEQFDTLGGYTIQARAEEILEGLGFRTEELQRPLREFSGGWRMRVMLAKMLLSKPALLLLDEPTNHLDLPSIQWLEDYLSDYEGAYIIVSHDREFLDNAIETTVEVANQKLNTYSGNYSFYLEEKALRNEIQRGAYENQQAKIRQTERFIERFKAKATKARQVQSRVKALDRMDMIDAVVDENVKVHFRFNFRQQSGRNVLSIEDVSKSYPQKPILKHATARIERGDKIALIGANGKGKSTLLRIVAGTENIDGKREIGHNVNFAFFAQHQLEALNVENTILDELKQAGTNKTEVELRTVLGCFLFSNDEVFKKIKVLSGGEKSRVALAKTLISEANFLLLDEPTNHLDMQSVSILIQALEQYEGTYVVISHDRHFVSHVANKIWFIEDYQIKEYPGTYDEFETWYAEREKNKATQVAPIETKSVTTKPVTSKPISADPTVTKNLQKANRRVEELEKKIAELETQKHDLEHQMAHFSAENNTEEVTRISGVYQQVMQTMDKTMEDWEVATLEVEELEKKLA
ncbi:ABC-F family ATP-binding cassette domain-containing protein [Cytophagaceae bacterium DM2B3-1]|uniref:ABC-F family ATP-binding cassette domain-containing protein n=1 Tax=Xanthocytophaga flava TaxID=3048013 RepID=A0ABT7CQY3_9BACT|nr:ABC-F family ATP-binding cassette domain-containing protein [Xanthocytophaga flavus]MDJ1468026.1 ABC-F family ATP-binding cassette domain-containing protein [Xanthocytophaga flavus]MDJ1495921.1 ABC-F family ATP-binding cassette domain-containing protein [Xanthocytophaga flavus]